jgi:hypothetical protein
VIRKYCQICKSEFAINCNEDYLAPVTRLFVFSPLSLYQRDALQVRQQDWRYCGCTECSSLVHLLVGSKIAVPNPTEEEDR